MRHSIEMAVLVTALMLSACGGGGDSGAVPVSASLAVSLTAPAQAIPAGSRATLTLDVSNGGGVAAQSVSVSSVLGKGLTLNGVSCKSAGGAVCPTGLSGTSVQLSSLPAHSSLSLLFDVTVTAGSSGEISSDAVVTEANGSASSAGKASAVMRTYSADVTVSAAALSPTLAGSATQHTFTVSNAGPDAARDVKLTFLPDAGASLAALTCTGSAGGQCPKTLGQETLVPELPKGASLSFKVPVNWPGSNVGTMGVMATAQALGDSMSSNNSAQSTVRLVAANTVQLSSDFGDYIGGGRSYRYSNANARLVVNAIGRNIDVQVAGDEDWRGSFRLPDQVAGLVKGSYSGLTRAPFSEGRTGGLEWSGEGRGCNTLMGSLTIDNVLQEGTELLELDFSFVQHCEGGAAALRGTVHWSKYDTSTAPGPKPVPAGLWDAPSGVTPATGNYIYLDSQAGDYIGGGQVYLYTPGGGNTVTVAANGRNLNMSVNDAKGNYWRSDFVAMDSLTELTEGYYGDLQRYPFFNAMKGGFDWSGSGRGCNTLKAWVVIDKISHVAGSVSAIDLRFEQHCEGMAPALRGKVHWVF